VLFLPNHRHRTKTKQKPRQLRAIGFASTHLQSGLSLGSSLPSKMKGACVNRLVTPTAGMAQAVF
jgi:hypothetical protein